jgi:hypothetical protein
VNSIRRSPCEAYLKYLIVHPDGLTNEKIRNIVKMQQLDFLGTPYLDNLRQSCVPPTPFYPENPRHAPSMRFLLREGLDIIFRPTEDMRLATKLLDTPRAKELIESMRITGSSNIWIDAALRRNNIKSSVAALELYVAYYFNLDLVDPDELDALISKRMETGETTKDRDEQQCNYHYREAMKRGQRLQGARAAITPFAGMLGLIRRGLMPPNMEITKIAAAARNAALLQATDTMFTNPEQSRDYAIIVKVMGDLIQQVGDVEDDLREGLAKMMVGTDPKATPNIKELSAGEHTLDLQPIDTTGEVVGKEKIDGE